MDFLIIIKFIVLFSLGISIGEVLKYDKKLYVILMVLTISLVLIKAIEQ